MRTPLINRILAQVSAPPPQGCQAPAYRRAIEEFFRNRTKDGHLKYYLRFRNLAEFRCLPRPHWPGAIEGFFAGVTKADATENYRHFKSWLKVHRPIYIKPTGPLGIGLENLAKHLRSAGLIDWQFDGRYHDIVERAWSGIDRSFRMKAEEFLGYMNARNYSKSTIKDAKGGLRVLGKFLKRMNLNYFDVTYEVATDFVREVLAKPWSQWHQRGVIEKARSFNKWLVAREEVRVNHFDTLRPIGGIRSLPRFLTEDEMNLILNQSLDPRERVLIEFFYATGCRVGEAIGLNLSDLSLKSRTIKCLGKGRKERLLFFNKATEVALKEYLVARGDLLKKRVRPQEPALFVGRWGHRICNIAIDDAVRATCYRAGITKRVTPHVLRHTFATHMLNHGADLHSLMTLMGHASIEATIRYLHVATERLSTVYRKCHPRK